MPLNYSDISDASYVHELQNPGSSAQIVDTALREQAGEGNPYHIDYQKWQDPREKEKFEVEQLIRAYENDELRHWDEEELEQLMKLAATHQLDIDREGKPFKKFAFDAIDWTLFGLVPNKWRPEAPGDEYFGETGGDKAAGWIGTIGGLVGGGLLLTKGGGLVVGGLGRAGMWGLRALKGTQVGAKTAAAGTKGLNYLNQGKNVVLSAPGRAMGMGTPNYATRVGQYGTNPYGQYGQASFYNMAL